MLHIYNGDASAKIGKCSSLPGEHFAFREALVEGPAPANLSDAEWRKLRAQHLSLAYGVDVDDCERELTEQEKKLSDVSEHDEIVLWFEHDLFCQVHLIYLLDWFSNQKLRKTKLSLICIGEFPGKEKFRGLGELDSEEFASLFPQRKQVTKAQFALAVRAWKSYRSRDPRHTEALLESDISSLPFLGPALAAHLKRFPSTRNGLGSIENTALKLLNTGLRRFDELFADFVSIESIYGFGDAQLWFALKRMSDVGQPLLEIEAGDETIEPKSVLDPAAKLKITELGTAVLDGDADFLTLNGIDQWLGGVYLNDERNLFCWDETLCKIAQCSTSKA